jgi:hypothetical protein
VTTCRPPARPVDETGVVSGINRVDRAIGVALLLVLVALVGLGIADSRSAARAGSGPLTGPGTLPSSPTATTAPVAPSTTPGGLPTTTSTAPLAPLAAPVAGPVTAVGDSVLLDAQPELATDVPGIAVDGLVSRQFDAGIGVVQADRAAGTLGKVLVVELGTNGPISPGEVDAMVQAASGVARVVFVNVCVPRPWAAPDNAVLADGVARHPGVAVLADWNSLATAHPEWFTSDQVHLNPAGAVALATLIASLA